MDLQFTFYNNLAILLCILLVLSPCTQPQETPHKYNFIMPQQFGNLTASTGNCCEFGIPPLPVGNHRKLPSVLGLGVHKSATTYLFHLLKLHPQLQSPASDVKELYMFAEWPVGFGAFDGYLRSWPEEYQTKSHPDKELFEVTATYLHVPGAACRIQSLLPQARMIILLRDPVSRALSHYNMASQLYETGQRQFKPGPFTEVIERSIKQVRNFGCAFDGTDPQLKSWNDCYRCWYVVLDANLRNTVCKSVTDAVQAGSTPCSPLLKSGMFVQFGTYAAPIAWWLNFFKPEQFMFINIEQLIAEPVNIGNRLAEFLQIKPIYSKDIIENNSQFIDKNMFPYLVNRTSPEIAGALSLLQDYYKPQIKDLYQLFDDIGAQFQPFKDWPRSMFEE